MNQRQLSLAFAQLVAACGGVKTAAHVAEINKSRIYAAQDPNDSYSLTLMRVARLEDYCGEAIVSAAMARGVRCADKPCRPDLHLAAMDQSVAMTTLARAVHLALADGTLSNTERNHLTGDIATLQRSLSQIARALDTDTDGPPKSDDPVGRSRRQAEAMIQSVAAHPRHK